MLQFRNKHLDLKQEKQMLASQPFAFVNLALSLVGRQRLTKTQSAVSLQPD